MATDTTKPAEKEDDPSNARKSPSTSTVDQRPPNKKEDSSSEINAPPNPNDNKNVSSASPVPPRPASASSVHSNGRSTAVNITNSQPNRPPSSASAHSANSGTGAPRTTATSRRGGRTRCRSPPTMITHRPGSAGPPPPPTDPYSPRQMDDRPPPPPPTNPSAAAAAAAAAAKSITRTPPPPSSWYESTEAGGRDYGRRPHRGEGGPPPQSSRYPPQHHMPRDHRYGYEGGPMPPSSRWPPPGEDGRPSSRSGRPGGGVDPRYGSYRRGEDHYGYREGGYFPRRGGRGEYPPYDEHMEYDRRYQEHAPPPHGGAPYDDPHRSSRGGRGVERGETSPYGREDPYGRNSSRDRLRPPREHPQRDHPPREHPREHQREHSREDPYYSKEQEGSRAAAGAPSTVKRTTRVIGTATPIHMPRASEPQSRPSRRESAASEIFRGRPGSDARPSPRNEPSEESPQKILMALRTPSTSFEEKPSNKRSDAPLSPEAPPQMSRNTDFDLSFEPQASPKSQAGPPQPTSSIDMAPSFNLFNQSFDSIGDTAGFFNVDGPLGSALAQSTSFGVPSASLTDDKISDQLQLHPSSSGGNFTQQLLGGSGSAGLTFGMSPSNSFGGAGPPPSSRGSSNVVRLGGEDHRSADQVLDMYRSYSGGASPRAKPGGTLDETHIRMSGTNLGSPIVANPSYNRSFSEAPPPAHYGNRTGPPPLPDGANGPLGFYVFLRRHKDAFRDVMFLLPGLKAALLEAPDVKKKDAEAETPKRQTRNSDPYGEPSPQEIAIARRRISCAICAFGGTNTGDRPPSTSPQQKDGNAQSIFREKPGDTATVTPNSSASTNPGNRHVSRQRAKYEEILPSRYYENDNRLSWEFEENPPIGEIGDDDGESDSKNMDGSNDKSKSGNSEGRSRSGADGDDNASQTSSAENGKKTSSGNKEDQPKMKYRCKLCGQPKQNHTCPYQQSLARSIGTMIYPAVNAFTAAEPGLLAPALSEMNNFMISGSESVSSAETSPSRPTPDRMRRMNQGIPPGTAQVTPESLVRSTRGANSPLSAVSGGTSTPQRNRTPGSSKRKKGTPSTRPTPGSVTSTTSSKRRRTLPPTGGSGPGAVCSGGPGGNGSEDQGDLLFVESVELKPEQFRIVSQMKALTSESAFTYAPLPLPYAQRKRLSDNLFSLSKEVLQLTDECAAVLREAREKDMWDLAVAELMTQVVVVVHCSNNMVDSRFDGLRRYLLTLGISC